MAHTIGMPKLGLTMETGAVGAWLVSQGEAVKAGQVIAEVVTEKITYELESEVSGVVLRLLVEPEVEVPVGTPIAVIGEPGEDPGEVR
jgi:pyruvate/2-oxoglutarate dehydrogenase complex dihydrolipoamide acyltransferase (E2) component